MEPVQTTTLPTSTDTTTPSPSTETTTPSSTTSTPPPPNTTKGKRPPKDPKFKYVPKDQQPKEPKQPKPKQTQAPHTKARKPLTINEKCEREETKGKRASKQAPPASATCILPHLYLGSSLNASDATLAKELNLTCVLNVAEEFVAVVHEGVNHVRLVVHDFMPDGQDQFALFEQAFLHIDEAKEKNTAILVHCMRGRSRSATIVIGYLMTRNKMTLEEAHRHVKKLRPFIGPHKRLKKQLVHFEKHLFGNNTVRPEHGYDPL